MIVDTGIRDLEEYRKAEPGVKQTPDQVTTAAIKRVMGWEPDDIDIVINTHLHCDHSGSNREFKNAKFYVQKKEWEAAFKSSCARRRLFTIKLCYDKNAVNYFQWNFLEGDTEILPGLRVITTPGHTRGHQSVMFDTKDGVVCVSGDICNVAENVNGNLEPNIVVMVPETYESFERIPTVCTLYSART